MKKWYGRNQRDNRIWLKRFMKHFALTRKMVAESLGVHLSTVDRWLIPPGGRQCRQMPNMARKTLTVLADSGAFDLTANGS